MKINIISINLIVLMLTFFLTGCLVIPIPHKRIHSYGVSGQIIDENDFLPITNTIISSSDVKYRSAMTDENGVFFLPDVKKWHYARFYGVISFSLLPTLDAPNFSTSIKIISDGYEEKNIEIFSIYNDIILIRMNRVED